jgi:hypothetical protein
MTISRNSIALFMLVGAVVCGVCGYREVKIRSAAKAEPQTITCAELEANGPGDNAHVIMTDFYLCDFAYVYEARGPLWTRAFVPAVPKGSDFHKSLVAAMDKRRSDDRGVQLPPEMRVIVEAPDATCEWDITHLGEQEEIQGTIVNVLHNLDDEAQVMLEESYPGVDFDNVWILEVGLGPVSSGKIGAWFVGCAALALAGIGVYVSGSRSD